MSFINSQQFQAINQIVIILIIVAVFYFLLLRPQIKRQKERTQLVSSIKAGDKIMTIGGIVGTITKVDDDRIMLEVAKNVILEMSKTAVANKVD